VHIFPIRYNNTQSTEYFSQLTKDNPSVKKFAGTLRQAYDYFDKQKQLPVITISKNGDYVIM